jgi:ABC-type transport system involved in multi-copper enzyme maturation permease subunit
MMGLVQCSSMKKLVLILILLIVIGTPYTIPVKPLVELFAETIFAECMLLGMEVMGSMAFSAVARFMVFSSAPESNKLRNWVP